LTAIVASSYAIRFSNAGCERRNGVRTPSTRTTRREAGEAGEGRGDRFLGGIEAPFRNLPTIAAVSGAMEGLRMRGSTRASLVLALLAAALPAAAQAPPDPLPARLAELNHDVWIPFSKAYATNDAEGYLRLHTKDLIRVAAQGKSVQDLAGYAEGVRKGFEKRRAEGSKAEIAFRFLERIASDEAASERGIFRLTVTSAKGEARRFHGKFHVFERKVDGVWRIAVDYDSNEGGTIDAKAFETADSMESGAR
jgi:uncharacterized protein (TIGR02246 family)